MTKLRTIHSMSQALNVTHDQLLYAIGVLRLSPSQRVGPARVYDEADFQLLNEYFEQKQRLAQMKEQARRRQRRGDGADSPCAGPADMLG